MDRNKTRLEVIESATSGNTCQTFILHGEDYTLGNALRYVISRNPQVQFCGCTKPHPTNQQINLRIQTYGESAGKVFKKGLEDLQSMCEHISETFEESVRQYKELKSRESGDMSLDA